jgi:ribosomal protein S18 acetylase RimI-like enzyme
MSLKIATPEDAVEILALQKLAYQSEAAIYNDYSLPPLVQTLEDLVSDFQKQIVLKFVIDGQIIGSVRGVVRDGTGYISRLIVHPVYQHRGIGTRLMQSIEEQLGPVPRYELFTGHKSENNLRLYQKLGYRIFHTAPVNDQLSFVYLEKNLLSPSPDR